MERWANLGLWAEAGAAPLRYPAAARALAIHLGVRAGLGPGQRVLDLGVGCGDQLRVWSDTFDVAEIVALEPHGPARASAAERIVGCTRAHVELLGARADRLPLEALGRFDAVLALDCAYHFSSRSAVSRRAFDALVPGGVLAAMDLLPTADAPGWLRRLAPRFGIPDANWVTASQLAKALALQGYADIAIEDLSHAVLAGFARHVARHRASLARAAARVGPGALVPVLASAALAGAAARRGWLGFVCVTARRPAAAGNQHADARGRV